MVKTFSSGPGRVVTLRPRSSITAEPVLTPGMVWRCWTARGVKPSASKARTRSEADPSNSWAARRTASVAAWPAISAAVMTATPSATPSTVRAVRSGRLARLRQASAERCTRYRPSSARRMISGRASWSSRRPSWIVSRISPSRTTSTRSA